MASSGCWPVALTGCIRARSFRSSPSRPAFPLTTILPSSILYPNAAVIFPRTGSTLAAYLLPHGKENTLPVHNSKQLFGSAVDCTSQFNRFPVPWSERRWRTTSKAFNCSAQEQQLSRSSRVTRLIKLASDASNIASFADGNIGSQQSDEDPFHVSGQKQLSDMIFLGTGTSEGVPRVSCLTNLNKRCPVCWSATQPGDRNRRRNTSVLVRYPHPDGRVRHILIDAGKFFYHSALQWFPFYGIRHLDAVIITHSHADAIGGLDDLRDWTNNVQDEIPIYVTERDLEVMKKTHYYLVDSSGITKGTAVSKLHFNLITEEPFFVHGLKVTPLPVWHGPGYRSLGFRIGDLCYISDVSEIPEETYPLLANCDILILDALRPDRSSSTHFGLPAAMEEVRKIRPKKTFFTGMMHTTDHNLVNAQLAPLLDEEGLDMELSFDGMRVRFSHHQQQQQL